MTNDPRNKGTGMEPPKLNVRMIEDTPDIDRPVGSDMHDRDAAADNVSHDVAPTRPVHALPSNVAALPSAARLGPDSREKLRILEAVLFAAAEPLGEAHLAQVLKSDADLPALLAELQSLYASRGINLVRVSGKWAFRTADDLSYLLERHAVEERRLSKAALETLAIVAYHQPVTRSEIEEIRGVETSKGTLDILLETGWIRPRGRRRAPGKPLTYGTTDAFLNHFSLDAIKDLPGLTELKSAGLLDSNLPPDFVVPSPTDVAKLMPDELPLEDEPDTQEELPLDALEAGDEDGGAAQPPEASEEPKP